MAIALYVGAGRPGSRALAQSVNAMAPHWLQYGVCLFLSPSCPLREADVLSMVNSDEDRLD